MAATNGKDLIDQVKALKGSSIDVASEQNKSAINGGLIGMAAGAFYGFAKKKNLLVCALVGTVSGYVIAKLFTVK